jgi:hypothetical protein
MVKFKKSQSIRVQLIFLLSFSAMLGILLYSVVMFVYNFNAGKIKTIESISQLTSIMGLNLSASVEFDDSQSAEIMMSRLSESPNIMGAFIFKDQQVLFAPYYNPNINKQIHQEIQKKVSLLNASYDVHAIFEEINFDSIIIQRNISIKDEIIASFVIISDTNALKQTFFEQLYFQFIVSLVTLLIVILISNIIQKRFTAPIFKLKRQMEYIASENAYDIRMSRTQEDEFRSLYLGFNSMLDIIQKQQHTVAHEIAEKKLSHDLVVKQQYEIEEAHKHTRQSIDYAALIQGALMPNEGIFNDFFNDYFTFWEPKDIVGGDIFLFRELRNKDECLLMYIDCTGHGVPGAFVTMLVKAVEAQVIADIMNKPVMDVSPAKIMSFFNRSLKELLDQKSTDSKSNAGLDGGIIYYNRKTQILKFSGAETPLFYVDLLGELHIVKGNRYSVGYKKCDMDYQYKETIINVEAGMKFYCTTDGYLDQNGGDKDFPFGKKRFSNIIKANHALSMEQQKEIFIAQLSHHEQQIIDNERNDDITLIGFSIGKSTEASQNGMVDILEYEGVMTQHVIITCMDNIELKVDNIKMLGKISTLVVELCQNMMNYSKSINQQSRELEPAGFIHLAHDVQQGYRIQSRNIISIDDKEKIELTLSEIEQLDEESLRKRYRELRRSGKNTHEKGGGIGFYEIAKLVSSFEYEFSMINREKFYFEFTLFV